MNLYLSPILSSSQSQDETSIGWLHLGRELYPASPAIKEGIFEVKALHLEPGVPNGFRSPLPSRSILQGQIRKKNFG
jgi:hypothetical protein